MITGSEQGPAYDVKADDKGAVWLAAWNGVYSNTSGRHRPMATGDSGSDVGLYHCNDKRTEWMHDTSELISAYIQGLDFDGEGNLWAGDHGGVATRNEKGKIAEQRIADEIPNAFVRVVKRSPEGDMWVGTEYGIARFSP